MSHTTTARETTFHHDGCDLSGDVRIVHGDDEMTVPAHDLVALVAEIVRRQRVAALCDMEPRELLGLVDVEEDGPEDDFPEALEPPRAPWCERCGLFHPEGEHVIS